MPESSVDAPQLPLHGQHQLKPRRDDATVMFQTVAVKSIQENRTSDVLMLS
jgi:hypothetical protein